MKRVALGILAVAAAHMLAVPAAAQQARVSARAPQQDSLIALGVQLERITNVQRILMRDYQLANTELSRASSDATARPGAHVLESSERAWSVSLRTRRCCARICKRSAPSGHSPTVG